MPRSRPPYPREFRDLSPEEFERRWSANPESVSVTLSTKAG